jgi:hypothetical protein
VKIVVALIVLTLCAVGFAQTSTTTSVRNQQQAAALLAQKNGAHGALIRPFSSADCVFTFTSSTATTFLKYCVTATGNITVFETPAGHEHIAVGKDGEGYGICDLTTNVAYDDYAEFGDSGNWGPPTVVSQTATSVKIARTTSDQIWTQTQTFTQVAGNLPAVKIGMAIRNNTNVDRGVVVLRYVDVDADGVALNNLDATTNSAFGWNSTTGVSDGGPFGLVLQNIGTVPLFNAGVVQNAPDPPNPCGGSHAVVGPLRSTDGSLVMFYEMRVPKSSFVTVTVGYKGI